MNIFDRIVDVYYAAKFKAEDLVYTVRDKIGAIFNKDEFAHIESCSASWDVEEVVEKPRKKKGRKTKGKTKKKK